MEMLENYVFILSKLIFSFILWENSFNGSFNKQISS